MAEYLWCEIYRPKTVAECVLPERVKAPFAQYVTNKVIPNMLLCGTAGTGKCLDPDEPVIMFDGTIKRTGDIVVGDLLMGPDSRPRTVLATNPGYGQMFQIVPVKGTPWKCNGHHILSLKIVGTEKVVFMTVFEWMGLTKYKKTQYKIWRPDMIEFPYTATPKLDAYFLGTMIGDGTVDSSAKLHNPDIEVIEYARTISESWGIPQFTDVSSPDRCPSWFMSCGRTGPKNNPLLTHLRSLISWKCEEKSIPYTYKTGSVSTRLEILAGLLDTDGHLSSNCYDFISKSKQLAEDVAFIARSLGLAAYVTKCTKSCQNNFTGEYFRVSISGNVSIIPVKIMRKKATARKQIKSVRKTGFDITPIGDGDWFGIVLDGDHQYLLADFTVTHNTTIARAMCDEAGLNHMLINSSDERGIDTLRGKITSYASTVSLTGGHKVIILDEADSITPDAQKALRGAIEAFSSNCSFIFTCNYKAMLIEPLHSRCSVVDFTLRADEKPKMALAFSKRLGDILTTEGVKFQKGTLATIISKFFPDFRRTINELQRYASVGNSIDDSVLNLISEVRNLEALIKALHAKDFTAMRKWVGQNSDTDQAQIFRRVYDGLYSFMQPKSIPQAVVILGRYQYQSAFCADQEINAAACFTELMVDCEFKA